MFLHNGITHLVVNSYSLYVLGTTVEMIMGKGRFLFIYLMAGLMGSIVSFIFSIAPSVGRQEQYLACWVLLFIMGRSTGNCLRKVLAEAY